MELLDRAKAEILCQYASRIQRQWRSYHHAKLRRQQLMAALAIVVRGDSTVIIIDIRKAGRICSDCFLREV